MSRFNPGFEVGSIVKREDIKKAFGISLYRGMNRSLHNNVLVLISKHVDNLYEDKWFGDVLYYTGEGQDGDQKMVGQNKTLRDSAILIDPKTHGKIEVHLFEVFKEQQYTYQGVVQLDGAPWQDKQKDTKGNERKVWIFPLKLVNGKGEISQSTFDEYVKNQDDIAEKETRGKTEDELRDIARKHASKKVSYRNVQTKGYTRDKRIEAYAKKWAHGICQLCGKPAPFKDKKGEPYLESHHIVWLSKGGEDSPENVAALCPNCHRKMHEVNDPNDVKKLQEKAKDHA